ncbi:hypothetical protein R69746_07881 [Paraburkholderia aspalathi]|nr:hypothetical protein R69746_07881 [Paraburkholderia aspalathi]
MEIRRWLPIRVFPTTTKNEQLYYYKCKMFANEVDVNS